MGDLKEDVERNLPAYLEVEPAAGADKKEQLLAAAEPEDDGTVAAQFKKVFWHGGSAYDAWFSSASNQVSESVGQLLRIGGAQGCLSPGQILLLVGERRTAAAVVVHS